MTATVKLYELAEARDILDELLAETEGEVTPEIQSLLDGWQDQTTEKVEKVALYVREQLTTAEAISAEIERLTARKKAMERAAAGLKGYLHAMMERVGIPKVNGLLVTVQVQKNAPSVRGELDADHLEAMHGSALWHRFVRRIPATYALDKKAVLDAAKAGAEIPRGLVVEQGTSLRIR